QSGAAATSTITLTSAWQQVSVSYSPRFPAGGSLNLWASTRSAPGTCFDADDAAIVFTPGPAAALTLTPAAGIAPLVVRADASASTATKLPIASYTFDFGPGVGGSSARVGPQAEPTAEHSYAAAGTYQVLVTVTDSGGGTSFALSQVTVAPGIVANPSF